MCTVVILRRPAAAWDVTHRSGGLHDFETLIRLWQLRHAPDHRALAETNPARVLAQLAALDLVEADRAHVLLEAHHLLRQVDTLRAVALDEVADPAAVPSGLQVALQRAAGVADQAALEAAIDRATGVIAAALAEVTDAL